MMADELNSLQALGLTLPSPAYIFGAIVFGLLGMAAFRSARKSGHRRSLWLGVALMVYPYLVSPTWLLYVVGAGLCAGIYLDHR